MSKATNTVGYQPNWDNIAKLIEQGYIREVTHPEDESLKLYNYTQKAQYDQHWTKDVLICRGLIARDGVVIARPFPKFFNHQELAHIRQDDTPMVGPWMKYEKLDGSAGILYEFAPGDYRIATRGSFTSDQAIMATKIFNFDRGAWQPVDHTTYIFEIIYPENRIVVDYGKTTEIILLARLDTATGIDVTPDIWIPFKPVRYHGIDQSIPTDERDNHEGYVLVNSKGFRVKVKHDEYVRLHRIMTCTSSRTVWECLSNGTGLDEILDNIPDEFYDWVKSTIKELNDQFEYIEFQAKTCIDNIKLQNLTDRKEQADYINTASCNFWENSVVFKMLDNKPYDELIWKIIKPERTMPFTGENHEQT